MNDPKYKPIPFTAPMVRAILDGRKTQTRRIVKVQPPADGYELATCFSTTGSKRDIGRHHWLKRDGFKVIDGSQPYFSAPYAVGDRLWVRENWRTVASFDNYSPITIANTCMDAGYRKPRVPLQFEADGYRNENWKNFRFPNDEPGKLRASMFMPSLASRITLEVTGVRVERLQDISGKNAIAEGLKCITKDGAIYKYGIPDADGLPGKDDFGWPWAEWKLSPVFAYKKLWEQINGHGSWEKNPWVWVVEFNEVEL